MIGYNFDRMAFLHSLAKDFCKLTLLAKFNIGCELEVLIPEDAYMSVEGIEKKIWCKAKDRNKLNQLADMVKYYTEKGFVVD